MTHQIFAGQTALELGLSGDDGGLEITEVLLKAGAQLPRKYKKLAKSIDFIEHQFSLVTLLVQYGMEIDEKTFDQIRTNMGEEKEKQLRAASNCKVRAYLNFFAAIKFIYIY